MRNINFFSRKSQGLGLDLGSEWLKIVKLRRGKSGYSLESLARYPWQHSDLDAQTSTAKKITELWTQFALKDKIVVSSLAGHAVIIKRVTFEADSIKDLHEIVQKDARQYIPFDIKDVYLDYQVLGPVQREKQYDVLLVASKKNAVHSLQEIFTQSNLSLSVVDVDSFAICNSFEYNYPEYQDKPVYLLDIGGNQSVFCIYQAGQPLFLREISFGGRELTENIAEELGLKRLEAERIKINGNTELTAKDFTLLSNTFSKTLKNWCEEIKRLIGFYQSSSSSFVNAENIFISGGGALFVNFEKILQDELGIAVHKHDPFKRIEYDTEVFQKEYLQNIAPQMVVPFGLALRAI